MSRGVGIVKQKAKFRKQKWMKQEDEKLIQDVHIHGARDWKSVPQRAGLQRSESSCAHRWHNYLSPDVLRGDFTDEEKLKIRRLHSQFGKKWALIARRLPGRTAMGIKNFCNKRRRPMADGDATPAPLLLMADDGPLQHSATMADSRIYSPDGLSAVYSIIGWEYYYNNNNILGRSHVEYPSDNTGAYLTNDPPSTVGENSWELHHVQQLLLIDDPIDDHHDMIINPNADRYATILNEFEALLLMDVHQPMVGTLG